MVYRSNKSHIEPTFVSYLGSSPFASISNIENRDRIYQHYWNRRFAIPGFWPYACTPWKTSFPWRAYICQNPGIANLNNSTMAILSSKLNSKTSLGNYDSWIRGQVKQPNWSWSLPKRILLTPFFNSSLKPMTSLSTVKRASVYWQTNSFWQLDLGCWERFLPAWNSAVTPCANWWVQTHFSPSLKSARAVKYFSIGSNFLGISDF